MYDYSNFIDILNKSNTSYKEAIGLIKDEFHLGKLDVINKETSNKFEYVVDELYNKKPFMTYDDGIFEYNVYKNRDDHEYSKEELRDISFVLRLLVMCHKNYLSNQKAIDGELISFNTKLPNTHGYMKKLGELCQKYNMKDYNSYFINIKGFGLINRLYNNEVGDMAIIYYANKLKEFIEDDEALGHLGGDNFVAFIKKERHDDFISLVTSVYVELKVNNVKASLNLIGVVGYLDIDDSIKDFRELLTKSSIACQYARATKKLVVKLTLELYDMVNSIKNIENTFKDELNSGNFIVYYQPKFDIDTGKIVGVEALSRWVNKGKVVPPSMFVPILEKNGEILDLDLHVLECLCKDIHNFRNMGHKIVPASCNLSRRDFENEDLEDRVINIIKKYNVKSEDIVIEVTETTNLEEKERLAKFIDKMNENGIYTSIDDFGTGYSSLSVLRDFKVNEIKIDRSFINREALNDSDEIILGSIIDMAKRLNISVICEGVETKKQAETLMRLGCFKAQGFYYSKPLPKLEFEALLLKIGSIYD